MEQDRKNNPSLKRESPEKQYGGWAICNTPASQGVVIIDEVFMVKLQDWCKILSAFSQCSTLGGIKFVLVGDFNQLPPVGGSPFYTDDRFKRWAVRGELIKVELTASHGLARMQCLENF